jgi:hypothetical protein
MTLLLDGQKIQGKSLKVTANLRIESADLSGQTSNSDTAHKGFKPKTLSITLLIPFRDSAQLNELMRLAEATEAGGQLKTYRVVNDTAEAFGVRQAQFSDNVNAQEDNSLSAWRVQFSLSEKLSNPERVETRRSGGTAQQQAAPGTQIAPGTEPNALDKVLKQTGAAQAGTP